MNNSTFLPEDYLAQKADRRTNAISLSLFAVVMVAVFGAFLVTNQQWSQVKTQQLSINVRYQEAAMQIQQLTDLEQQKENMLNKASLAGALVERVPRSILLAELINRMPPNLGLLEFELKSEKIKDAPLTAAAKVVGRLGGKKARRAPTKEEAGEEINRVQAPRYRVVMSMIGVAPTDLEVSRYMAELNGYRLLDQVTLVYSEEKKIDDDLMRQFRINMKLSSDADVRQIEPLLVPRHLRDPMSDEVRYPGGEMTALPETFNKRSE